MHIGVIPDGNRRFMKKKGISRLEQSYGMGISKFHDFLEWCIDLSIKEVTVYALSLENLRNRSLEEISTLLNLFAVQAKVSLGDERIQKNGVKVNFCGDNQFLSSFKDPAGKSVIDNVRDLERSTKENGNLQLNIALAYGGRQEILSAVGRLVAAGEEVTEDNLRKHLWIQSYPEIIIRTSESRLSNFLLWQSAYSEIYFIDKLWQEIGKEDVVSILEDYGERDRRFGR